MTQHYSEKSRSRRFLVDLVVDAESGLADFLENHCPLSRPQINDGLKKGAVQVKIRNKGRKRVRKGSFQLYQGDIVSFGFDQSVLERTPPPLQLLHGDKHFSIWLKPPGILSQGTDYGDHCSLIRLADIQYRHQKKNFLVHRLDREVSGLVLTAHDRKAAGEYSQLFRKNSIEKKYVGRVRGCMGESGDSLVFDQKIDGKSAKTSVSIIESTPDWTRLDICISTGRKHQIRKHLSSAGFPLIGDCRYGAEPNSKTSIALVAYSLSFRCPFNRNRYAFKAPQKYIDSV